MKWFWGVFWLVWLPTFAYDQKIDVPKELRTQVNEPFLLTPTSTCDYLAVVVDGTNYEMSRGRKNVALTFHQAGTYPVFLYGSMRDGRLSNLARAIIVVEGETPAPPNPPTPPPTPPAPVLSDLAKRLKPAYDAESDPAKKDRLLDYVRILSDAESVCKAVQTVKQVNDVMHDATQKSLGDSLKGVRQACGQELEKVLGKVDRSLDDAARKQITDAHMKLAAALREIVS